MSMDFFACAFIVIVYVLKIPNFCLTGRGGHFLCQLIGSEMIIWVCFYASIAGIVTITVERYAKIVHPIVHKNYYR